MYKSASMVLAIIGIVLMGLAFSGSTLADADAKGVDLQAGNAEHGKEIYNKICIACHGDQAQGNPLLNAPRLVGQEPWYLARQLKNFVAGVRGSDTRDIYGMQMRPMALTLQGDQEIADLVAFITSLDKTGT